jgi:hypothetical protein
MILNPYTIRSVFLQTKSPKSARSRPAPVHPIGSPACIQPVPYKDFRYVHVNRTRISLPLSHDSLPRACVISFSLSRCILVSGSKTEVCTARPVSHQQALASAWHTHDVYRPQRLLDKTSGNVFSWVWTNPLTSVQGCIDSTTYTSTCDFSLDPPARCTF